MFHRNYGRAVTLGAALLLAACDGDPAETDAGTDAAADSALPNRSATLTVDGSAPLAEVDPEFVSMAVDTAQVVGGTFWDPEAEMRGLVGGAQVPPYDFSRERIRNLARALAPAYLRIGGSDADLAYFDLSDTPVDEAPEGYEWVFTREQWDGLHAFLDDVGFRLLLTLNLGPGPRASDGEWDPAQARMIMEHSVAESQPVAVWELGNEPNGFPGLHGLEFSPSVENHIRAFQTLAALRDEVDPTARVAGIASSYWPTLGELGVKLFPDFAAANGFAHVDVITWHYYPQQSQRCPLQLTRADPFTMLNADRLATIDTWAAEVEGLRDANGIGQPVWLGESGGAQCGGQPGVSDRFVGSFWWADQLGRMARRGQRVVVRQTLSGSNYGMIDDVSLRALPDYWTSLLWRQLMGERVLDAADDDDAELLTYAHCTPELDGGITVLLINIAQNQAVDVDLGALGSGRREVFLADGPLFEPDFVLNGEVVESASDGTPPALTPVTATPASALVEVPATSFSFIRLPEANADACR